MPFNDAVMLVVAASLQDAAAYGQLHSADAGPSGTTNLTAASRVSIPWGTASGAGDFGLVSSIDFTGGDPNGVVYSMTVWSAATDGVFYGQFVLDGDNTFDGAGVFSVTALDFAGIIV